MTPKVAIFVVLASLTGLSAVAVVVSQNIVRSAAWLLFTLAGTAGIYFLLGAEFVGATQLIVYVGGILVLVVFGVMLTAQGPFVSLKTGTGDWAIAGLVALLLFGILTSSILRTTWPMASKGHVPNVPAGQSAVALGLVFMGDKDAESNAPITGVTGQRPMQRSKIGYLLPFEIVSVHLLVVLIGAAYLARAKRRMGKSAG